MLRTAAIARGGHRERRPTGTAAIGGFVLKQLPFTATPDGRSSRWPPFTMAAVLVGLLIAPLSLSAAAAPSESAAQHYQSGLAYERLGRLNEAYTELQLACALDADDARLALALGVVALRLKQYDVAQRTLEHSIILDSNSTASYYELAYLYEKQNAVDRALDSWNRFLALNQDDLLKLEAQKHIRLLEAPRL